MTNITDAEIEAVARALCSPAGTEFNWPNQTNKARAAILAYRAALAAEGKKVVAAEASPEMMEACLKSNGITNIGGNECTVYPARLWRAMWEAASEDGK